MTRRSFSPTLFHAAADAPPVAWQIAPGLTPYPDALAGDGGARRGDPRRRGGRDGLAGRAPAALHGRHQRPAEDLLEPDRFPVFAPDAAANTPITGRASASPM